MGCEFNFTILSAKTKNEAMIEAEDLIEEAAHDHGHGGYTGSFAECAGTEFLQNCTPKADEVEDFLESAAEKWGPILVVMADDGRYYAGANCSS